MNAAEFELATQIIRKMKRKGLTLSVAESITGGLLAGSLTDVAGSSAVFLGGVVAYSDAAKVSMLGIRKAMLTKHTAVSEPVVLAMADSVRTLFKSDYAIATTGVAGPGKAYGQRAGTVWVGFATPSGTTSMQLALSGERDLIRHATLASALAAFARILSS
jgi:nicotinamide-nucleotide amidase